MAMQDMEAASQVAVEAANKAGQLTKKHFRKTTQIRYKGKANIVTDVDLRAEQIIVDLISREYPQHNILTEEVHSVNRGSELTWVIDPLDGTFNYAAGIPFFSTAIALARGDRVILGVVLDPLRNELFVARAGQGSQLNGKPVEISSKNRLQDALIGVDLGYDENGRRRALETMTVLRPTIQAYRVMGSAVLGLCYAACGRFDVYFHPLIYPWDIAAAALIVEEAGGVVTDGAGTPHTLNCETIVASNPALSAQFLSIATPHLARR